MTKTYSREEIEQQIFDIEGVKVRLHDQWRQTRFTQSYSEWALRPLSDDGTVSELQLKIDTFVRCTALDVEDDSILTIPEMREIDLRFRSGNSVDIQRAFIPREEWEALKDALRARIVTNKN